MMSLSPMGPGFFIFFRNDARTGRGGVDELQKKQREEDEIIAIVIALYESGAV